MTDGEKFEIVEADLETHWGIEVGEEIIEFASEDEARRAATDARAQLVRFFEYRTPWEPVDGVG